MKKKIIKFVRWFLGNCPICGSGTFTLGPRYDYTVFCNNKKCHWCS